MKRYWSGLAVAGMFAATAALGAQSLNPANTPPADSAAQPGSQRTETAPSAQQRTPTTVTVTGCIQNAPMASAASPGGAGQANPQAGEANQGRSASPAGAAASSQSGQRFVLSSARMTTSEAGRSAVGTSGTAASTYQLDGQTADVSKHLNHQVEITGTLQTSAASAAGSASAAQGAAAAGPTLRVTSVRMLASTCATAAPGTTGSTEPGPSDAPARPATPAGGNPVEPPSEPRPNQPAPTTRP